MASMWYSGPGTSYDRVEFIEVGTGTEQYTIEWKDAGKAVWYGFQYDSNYPDRTAWIRATHVQTYGNLDQLPVTSVPARGPLVFPSTGRRRSPGIRGPGCWLPAFHRCRILPHP